MIFSTREDIDAPIETVFDMLCEFDIYERAAMRRGAEVRRMDKLTAQGVGMKWHAEFSMRGKHREVDVEVTRFDRPNEIALMSTSSGLEGKGFVQLLALSKTRTRMSVEFEVKPTSLPARLLLQSLKLAKGTLTKRFKLRAAQYAKTLEDRARNVA
ncbi:hypothetical protein ASD8599_00635 [Ascidiaceihabitans donghaensis]|uniref:Coenzyme Q-binding protein COQ10 START domain-containing protein n=1 Tax=Ascidiaceihabitans donghaensis TaxID=1510460 RepID=A0A2R8BA00_9RHOB|nr:SRPBCC family protein [Ascidiaceihabitans donghaensis]SPH19895.1 hypothetical protein ASD8599_00635 [Ascidiaceihabitans donghaensis]